MPKSVKYLNPSVFPKSQRPDLDELDFITFIYNKVLFTCLQRCNYLKKLILLYK